MKTGIIVYIIGNMTTPDSFDEQSAKESLGVSADRVSFVFSGENDDDIACEWWAMTVKGMSRVVCMVGELVNSSGVRLTGRELQLAGF